MLKSAPAENGLRMLVLNFFRHPGRYVFLRSLVQILVRYSFSAGPIAQLQLDGLILDAVMRSINEP